MTRLASVPSRLLALALLVAACGGKAPPPQDPASSGAAAPAPATEAAPADPGATPTASTVPPGGYTYAPEVKEAFMSSCTENGGPEPVCACVLVKMQLRYSEADLANNAVSEEVITAMTMDCMKSAAP